MMQAFARRILTAIAFVLLATLATAQATAPDYSEWQTIAERAEDAVETASASDQALIAFRAEIVDWRQQFQTQQTVNDSRIDTLREQIAALGPVPEGADAEPEAISERRSELTNQVQRLTTPQLTAEEAFSRANGIIAEIDQLLRERQAEALLDAGPWPINPANWRNALGHLTKTLEAGVNGVRQSWNNPAQRAEAQRNLPLIIFFLGVGLILVTRARHWSEWLAERIQRSANRASAAVAAFVVSLGQIALPMLGLLAIIRALGVSDMFGERGRVLLEALEPMGFVLFFSLWLGSRVFPNEEDLRGSPNLPAKRRAEARVYLFSLAVVYALHIILERAATFDHYDRASEAVLHYPLIIVGGLLLIRMGWILGRVKHGIQGEKETERDFAFRLIALLGRAVLLVGFVAPLLATFGYNTAGKFLIYPTVLTLLLFGTVRLLQALVRDIYAAIMPGEGAEDSLGATLCSFAVLVLSMVILPLFWGARVTDLTEVWAQLRAGLTIGEMTISPRSLFTLVVVFAIGYGLTRAVQNALKVSVLPKTKIDAGGQVAIVSGLGYVGIFLAALAAITTAGIDLSNLAIVAGALSVGIGFGLQTIVSNFVSGIILLIERPVAEGDWIEVGGHMGFVRSISVRSTRIETFDRTDVIVPNSDLIAGTVTNYTRGNTVGRVIVPVGVAYGTDTRRVEGILRELAEAHPMATMTPPPQVLFMGFGADSLDFEIRIILRDVLWMVSVKSELNHQIAARFIEEGIEIPFAQRDVWLRNPEALQPPSQSQDPARDSNEPHKPGVPAEAVPEVDAGGDPQGDADADGDGR